MQLAFLALPTLGSCLDGESPRPWQEACRQHGLEWLGLMAMDRLWPLLRIGMPVTIYR